MIAVQANSKTLSLSGVIKRSLPASRPERTRPTINCDTNKTQRGS